MGGRTESPGTGPAPSPSPGRQNGTGFATIALSRAGYAGREHDTGAQLLRASSPEAVVTLDGGTHASIDRVAVLVWGWAWGSVSVPKGPTRPLPICRSCPPPFVMFFFCFFLCFWFERASFVCFGHPRSVEYNVGGLTGQKDFAFLNFSLLATDFSPDPAAFYYTAHRTGVPATRYDWTPGSRHSDPTLSWPPKGITLEIDFAAPAAAPAAHRAVTITVMCVGLGLFLA